MVGLRFLVIAEGSLHASRNVGNSTQFITDASFSVFFAVVRNLQRSKLKSGGTRIVEGSIGNTFQCEEFLIYYHRPRVGIGHTFVRMSMLHITGVPKCSGSSSLCFIYYA